VVHKLFFDGGKRGNNVTYGVVIHEDNKVIFKIGGELQIVASSNCAEYIGLILGLVYCRLMGIRNINVYGDSLLIVNQIKGLFKVKNKTLNYYNAVAHSILGSFEEWNINWVPRETNVLADRESRDGQ
jgi:ribonuclease HI